MFTLLGNQLLDSRIANLAFEQTRLLVQAAQGAKFLLVPEFRLLHG
jgi:hypothetical protein